MKVEIGGLPELTSTAGDLLLLMNNIVVGTSEITGKPEIIICSLSVGRLSRLLEHIEVSESDRISGNIPNIGSGENSVFSCLKELSHVSISTYLTITDQVLSPNVHTF